MHRDASLGVHHCKLPNRSVVVAGQERFQSLLRTFPLLQQPEPVRSEGNFHESLRGDRADSGLRPRHHTAGRQVAAGNCNAEILGCRVECHDRKRVHVWFWCHVCLRGVGVNECGHSQENRKLAQGGWKSHEGEHGMMGNTRRDAWTF